MTGPTQIFPPQPGMEDSQGYLDFDPAHLSRLIHGFGQQLVVCLGDLMLDLFVYGEVRRISPEAPVPVIRYRRELKALGGSGNVVNNLSALGARAACIGVIGDDEAGSEVSALLARESRISSSLVTIEGRATTSKVRYIAGAQQVVRVDREDTTAIEAPDEDRVLAALEASLVEGAILHLSDYAKGLLTDRVVREAIDMARAKGMPVVVEPKGTDYGRYRGATLLIANSEETAIATGLACRTDAEANIAIRRLQDIGKFDNVITTRSERGLMSLDAAGIVHGFPARAQQVFDVSGAGDTVNAVAALALGAGGTLAQAAFLANQAAGIVVSKLGTSVTSATELLDSISTSGPTGFSQKICDSTAMRERARDVRLAKRKLGFTNGCFDILHAGHISLLTQARAACDFLVVGLNSDASVARLKGPGRPVNSEHDRAIILAALEVVDGVVVFDDDTPLALIEALEPDVLVKGADYTREGVVGADLVEARGGQVLLGNLLAGLSTTNLIRQLENAGREANGR